MVKLLNRTDELDTLIKILKSESKVAGYRLRNAHIECGRLLGACINRNEDLEEKKICVLAIMRSGFFLALGIAEVLEIKGVHVEIRLSTEEDINFKDYDKVIISSAVVNTGSTVQEYAKKHNLLDQIVACGVIPEENLDTFNNYNFYTVRLSPNTYKGSNNKEISNGLGPDTGERLFKSSFFD